VIRLDDDVVDLRVEVGVCFLEINSSSSTPGVVKKEVSSRPETKIKFVQVHMMYVHFGIFTC
jgi:hypothetical protein